MTTRARVVVCALLLPLLVLVGGEAGATTSDTEVPVDPQVASETRGRSDNPRAPQTTTVTYGPFTVPAAMGEGMPGMLANAIVRDGGCRGLGFCLDMPVEKPCEDCYITRIVPNLVDADTGETVNFANGGMLHHVVNLNWSASDVTCPAGPGRIINLLGAIEGGNDRFFAVGNERTLMELPQGYGLPVSAEDEWGLIVDLMNMTPAPRQMALEYTFTWVETGAKPVTPVWLDIDNCGDSEFEVPHGEYSDTHADWTSTIDGRVMALAGHLHDHGISVAAENATRGKPICTSLAGYEEGSAAAPIGPGAGTDRLHPADWWHMTESDHPDADLAGYEGHIAGATGCMPRTKVAVGDTIRLHAQYHMGHAGHGGHDVMGIMVAYVHEKG
jgi:hypothetical protein